MLTIRLARFGKKKQPYYRLVINEKIHPPKGNVVEYLGSYNPKSKELVLERERIEYWLKQGATYSRTVAMIFVKEGLLKKEDLPALFVVEKKRKKKKEQPEEAPKAVPAETPADSQPVAESVQVDSESVPIAETPVVETKIEEKPNEESAKEEPAVNKSTEDAKASETDLSESKTDGKSTDESMKEPNTKNAAEKDEQEKK